jgi:PQQ-dependent catabolism-associated beta-propeller protein
MALRISLALALIASALPGLAKNTGYLFVSSEDDDVVTVLDGNTLKPVKEVRTAERPRGMRFSPDHKQLYVACGDGDSIDFIDVAKLAVVDRMGVAGPETFDLSPDGKVMYVSNEDDALMTAFDLASKKEIGSVSVGPEPEGVLATPDGKTVYVASEVASMVHVVDAKRLRLRDNVIVDSRPRRLALTPDGKHLWVSSEIGGTVSVIDTATDKVTARIVFEPEGFRAEDITPVGIEMTEDGATAFVALGGANHVAVVDVADLEVADYILVGKRPWNLELTADDKTLYVVNGQSDDVSVIDVEELSVTRSVPAARTPYGVAIDD